MPNAAQVFLLLLPLLGLFLVVVASDALKGLSWSFVQFSCAG